MAPRLFGRAWRLSKSSGCTAHRGEARSTDDETGGGCPCAAPAGQQYCRTTQPRPSVLTLKCSEAAADQQGRRLPSPGGKNMHIT